MKTIKLPTRIRRRSSVATTSTVSRDSSEDTNSISSMTHPMLRKRKRSLTIPLLEPVKVGLVRKKFQETNDQLQSLLFACLPLELRLTVWELVIGGFHIHIFGWAPKLGHLICCPDAHSPEGVRKVCIGPVDSGNTHGVLHREPYSFLSLPLTCRRIYSESVKLIYSLNTFHFLNYRYRMSRLSSRVLPHRWNCIRRIYLTYYQPRPSNFQDPIFVDRWRSQCAMLAQMPNLHKLAIVLACPRIQCSDDSEWDGLIRETFMTFLQALRDVHVHGTFDVYVPYSTDDRLNEAFFPEEFVPFCLRQVPAHVQRFHENQAYEIPIEQAVRAFDY